MTDTTTGKTPPEVAEGPKQGGDERERHPHAKPWVWTERMLAALENGVKGGKWFSLMDKVYARRTLEGAWDQVRRNQGAAGIDGQSVMKFQSHTDLYLDELQEALRTGRYQPTSVRRVWIDKANGGKRPLGIPTVKDRIVQTALLHVMEPIFEKQFSEHSYGFRPGRSCKDALRRVDQLLHEGYTWVVDADIQSYFDTIDHERLLTLASRTIADGKVLALLNAYLKQGVLEGTKTWKPTQGTPQGAVISPLLANVYLHSVDESMEKVGFAMTRYADDLVILCRSEGEARRALSLLGDEMARLGLTLHPEKTRLVDATQPGGFDFLGYHFERGKRWPRSKSLKALRDKVRQHTRRSNGHSLEVIIQKINPILRGWYGYFKHSNFYSLKTIDSWVRTRLRSILRARIKCRGRARRTDNRRWPNRFLAEQGLFTMAAAHAAACQSRCGTH